MAKDSPKRELSSKSPGVSKDKTREEEPLPPRRQLGGERRRLGEGQGER